ncbi:uncharacterized protein [Leptinotarsa decemlineata]|uniref:uncharacterized protein n=1 Tax=Leptinotarsa decemlineata TaxID=7539 RepID=UPI003D30C497
MDRKAKILLNASNKKDTDCIDFLNIPNYEKRGTSEHERDLFIQRQNELLSNEDLTINDHFPSPEIKVQDQIYVVSSTTKVYRTRLQNTRKKLFVEEKFINEQQSREKPSLPEVTSTIVEPHDFENVEVSSDGSEYIPETASELSESENESDEVVEDLGTSFNEKMVELTNIQPGNTDTSTSDAETVQKVSDDFGIYKQNGEVRKGKKKTDFCFYCETSVLNFARHVTRNHSSEFDVQKIMSKPTGSKERKLLLDLLRKRGNFANNNVICKPVQSLRSAKDLLPCDNCLGFFSAKLLWRHRNKCSNSKNRNHQGAAENILLANLRIDAHLKNIVFPRMRADEISLIAKRDTLICVYGARYIKVHREKHFINVASRKMREIARLLIEIKKIEPNIKCLFDALKPKYFDSLVNATKVVAKYNVEKDKFESPTYAMNIGTYLKQCAEIAIVFALKRKQVSETVLSAEAEADLKTLVQVIDSQWQYEVSSQAASDLNMNKWNKVTLVPLASDLKLLKEFLVSKADSAATALNNNPTLSDYLLLLETIFCRVILLNRRRPGELQRLKLDTYITFSNDTSTYEEFSDVVSPTEKILLNRFKRIMIIGKRGRGVPVLFSTDTQEYIQILLNHREKFVNGKNVYLFGKPDQRSTEPVCGYKVLKKYATACGAKNPTAITATRLRKHLATLTQLFDMSENDIEQLANFMGHTIGVHRGNYRLPDDVFQTAKISKLLILMEQGEAAQFKRKALNDIDLNMEEDLMAYNEKADREKSASPVPVILEPSTSQMPMETKYRTSKNKKRILVKWTDEQKKLIINFFRTHIKEKRPPKKRECEELKKLYPIVFENKNWPTIKVFIQNEYQKKK